MTHDHAHDHSHTPAVSGANERKVLLSFWLIFSFMLVEVAGGLLTGSLALLVDAGHMLTDAAALALAYGAFRFGRRVADQRRTFGYARFEVIAGFCNGVALFAIVVWIVWEAWQRIEAPEAVLAGPMIAVAVAGLLVNLLVFWILTRGDSEHVNVRGAALHVLGDLLGSVGAVVAGVGIALTGWTMLDPILSVLVSLLILGSAWRLLGQSLHILLEGAPEGADPAAIADYLGKNVPDLVSVSHVHVWSITSGQTLATLHVRPSSDERARGVVHAVEHALRSQFSITHATVAIDWNDHAAQCSLGQPLAEVQGHAHHHHGGEHTH